MSRPSVFRRIASWLKNTAKINEERKQKQAIELLSRQYTVQTLEDRHMLDASFDYNAVTDELELENFTATFAEGLTITETAAEYRFVLDEGIWSGPATAGISGAGTSDLRVVKNFLTIDVDQVEINDNLGIDILFDGVNFSRPNQFVTTLDINSSRGNLSQTALSSIIVSNLQIDGADDVTLVENGNQFGFITITDTNDVSIREGNAMDLSVIDVNNNAEFENNGLMILHRPMTIGGNLLLNSNNGDIYQERDAGVRVLGETFLKSNLTGDYGIDFGFGDRDNDGLNDNDFVGAVHVLQGSQIEIVDSNSLIIGDVTTHGNNAREIFQLYAEAENGSITIDGEVSVPGTDDAAGKVILRATEGGTETVNGRLLTDQVVVIGDGNFIFDKGNEVFDTNIPGPGTIAGDVTGNLMFHNDEDLQVGAITFEFVSERVLDVTVNPPIIVPAPPVVADINALEVRQLADGSAGNLTMTTSNDNLTQNGSAPVIVESLTTIDVGTGDVIWDFGDELGDLLNDNNWNRITVLNATNASFVDENEITIENLNVTNNARFHADNDHALTLDGEQVVGNNLLLQSDIGATQVGGFVDAAGLMVEGRGDFVFELANQLGDATTAGGVAANLEDGKFEVENLFGLEVTTLGAFGVTTVGIDGILVNQTRLRGSEILINQTLNATEILLESDSTISQTTGIVADSLIFRSNEDTILSTPNSVEVIAGEVEGNLDYNSDIEFSIGKLTYGGTTVAGVAVQNGATNDFNLTTNGVDVHQFLDAPVVVEGTLTIDVGLGCVGFAFGDGNGDTNNDNDFNIVVVNSGARIELVDKNDMTAHAIDVTDQIRLQTELGKLTLADNLTATNKVLLQSGNGIEQVPDDADVEGIINTAALMLQGDGAFILDHLNEVGDATTQGELAVEINGSLEFNNIFEVVSKNLSFDLKDGSTVTINGFTVNSGGDALVLNVSGLTIETEIAAPKIIINTTGDIIQGGAGRFVTEALVLTGVGNFDLTALNRIGTAGTPGLLAIDVEGDVEIVNEFGLEFGQIVCGTDLFQGATLEPGAFSDGDLTIRTTGMDITQSGDSILVVPGLTTFETGAGNVNLPGFTLAQNGINFLQIDSANSVEIANDLNLVVESVTVAANLMIDVSSPIPAQIVLNDTIDVAGQMMLKAERGVVQQRGFIVADTVLLAGEQDFNLTLDNEINKIGADIVGNLNIRNERDLQVVKVDYTDLNSNVTPFLGIDLNPVFFDGNLTVTTSDDDFTQDGAAHVRIADVATFDLGAGNLDLSSGDSNADFINDNDLNVLAIAAATSAEVVDQNSISIDNIHVTDQLFIQSEGGSIAIQGEVAADNKIMLKAQTGAATRVGALLDTDTLLVAGEGEFSLNGDNRIGAAAVPGSVGIDVKGDVILHNEFGVHFDNVSFTQFDATAHNISGATVVSNGFDGNMFVKADGSITDDDTIDVMVAGSAAFVAGPGSDVDLGGVNSVMATSVGLGGRNVTLIYDGQLLLDGVKTTGDLFVQSIGDINQTGVDPSAMAGSRFVDVAGNATFVMDATGAVTEQLNLNLLSVGINLMNNRFGGEVFVEGTSFATAGMGELESVQIRNAIVDSALFPTINRLAGDQLSSMTVWAPNSSLIIKDLGAGIDYDITGNMTVFAGVESETGQLGGKLKVTDNSKTRSLRDAPDVNIHVAGNFNTNAANTLVLASDASDSIVVGGTMSLVNQGGAAENRIRLGVASGGTRGDDSGALVEAGKLRTRANRNGTDGHVTVNLDNDIMFTNSNFATSLVAVSGGNIEDEAASKVAVAFGAFFDADGGSGDITLGDDADNRTIFGSVGFKGNNVSLTEDITTKLNGSVVGGTFDISSKASIRQTGSDNSGRAGTNALEIGGDATFTVDGKPGTTNHLADPFGRDVLLMNDGNKNLLDNVFNGAITIQTTQHVSGGDGTLRSVAVRNMAANAAVPTFNVDASDQIRNFSLWFPNSSIILSNQANAIDYDVAGSMMLVAGLESSDGTLNGEKIFNSQGDIFDDGDVNISVGRNASFYVNNEIELVDEATNSLTVGLTSTFVSKGGLLGNDIDVGTAGPRGTDSGGLYTTRRLKFTLEDNGSGGDLTIIADAPFFLDPTSSAPSVFIRP